MSSDVMKRMFDKFYRADANGHIPGTGLGMTLVKQIVAIITAALRLKAYQAAARPSRYSYRSELEKCRNSHPVSC
jgi:K+-sensing histidine kinase KdpD